MESLNLLFHPEIWGPLQQLSSSWAARANHGVLYFTRPVFFFFFYTFVYLFPFAGLGLCCCAGFALVWAGGAALSQSTGSPLCCVLLVRSTASVVEVLRLQRTGSIAVVHSSSGLSCPRGLWDLPRPGIKPVSPTLAGGFFTIEPPGKPET